MIEFTDEMVTALNNSAQDRMFVTVATASTSGMPDISYKGSTMAWDKDHIAFWERSLGTTYKNLQGNPQCCLLYTNFAARQVWKFFGSAAIHAAGDLRQRVMERTVQGELDRDPERKGAAIIVRIDQIVAGTQVIQER
ncbi:MAG: pyridoxamine 5'-phosphate oxidase family protein [Tepidiformaceae bacterium]